jgi:hypothetical protein
MTRLLVAFFAPSFAHAQATLAGTLRDSSGAVLPGATVEASSSALIERTRTAFSNRPGQSRITDLPPGIYDVTFSLAGFRKTQRQGPQIVPPRFARFNLTFSF